MSIESSSYVVFTTKHLLKKIYSYVPGRSAIKWLNGRLATELGHYNLIKYFGSNMIFDNATQIAAESNHKNNFNIFKWIVINIGIKQNIPQMWTKTIDTLALTNKKTMLRWLIMVAHPNKLNIKLYWTPDLTYEKVSRYKHYDIIKWMSVHYKGIQTVNITIEPINSEFLTLSYLNLLRNTLDTTLLIFIFEKIKDDIIIEYVLERCIKRNHIEIAQYICKDFSIDQKLNIIYDSKLSIHSQKVHHYLMMEEFIQEQKLKNDRTYFKRKVKIISDDLIV